MVQNIFSNTVEMPSKILPRPYSLCILILLINTRPKWIDQQINNFFWNSFSSKNFSLVMGPWH